MHVPTLSELLHQDILCLPAVEPTGRSKSGTTSYSEEGGAVCVCVCVCACVCVCVCVCALVACTALRSYAMDNVQWTRRD